MLKNVWCFLQRAANSLAVSSQAPSYDCRSEVARGKLPESSHFKSYTSSTRLHLNVKNTNCQVNARQQPATE